MLSNESSCSSFDVSFVPASIHFNDRDAKTFPKIEFFLKISSKSKRKLLLN